MRTRQTTILLLLSMLGGLILSCNAQRVQEDTELYDLFTQYGDEINCRFIDFVASKGFDGKKDFSCSDCVFNDGRSRSRDFYTLFVKESGQNGLSTLAMQVEKRKQLNRDNLTFDNWGENLLNVASFCLEKFPGTYQGKEHPETVVQLRQELMEVLERAYGDWQKLYPEGKIPVEYYKLSSRKFQEVIQLYNTAKKIDSLARDASKQLQEEKSQIETFSNLNPNQAEVKRQELDNLMSMWNESLIDLREIKSSIGDVKMKMPEALAIEVDNIMNDVAARKEELEGLEDFEADYERLVAALPGQTLFSLPQILLGILLTVVVGAGTWVGIKWSKFKKMKQEHSDASAPTQKEKQNNSTHPHSKDETNSSTNQEKENKKAHSEDHAQSPEEPTSPRTLSDNRLSEVAKREGKEPQRNPVSEEEKSIEQTKEVPTQLINHGSAQKPELFFPLNPTKDGAFQDSQKSLQEKPNSGFKATPKGKGYELEILTKPQVIKRALLSYDFMLKPVCELEGTKTRGTNLTMLSKGTIELEGDKWIVKNKIRIKIS